MSIKEKYKVYSDHKLIRVLLQKSEYQSDAVQAAREELENRDVDDDKRCQIEDAVRNELKLEEESEQEKAAKQDERKSKAISYLRSINPIQSSASIGERLILFVGLTYLILNAKSFYYNLVFTYYLFQDSEILNAASVFTTLNLILFLTTLYFYFKRSPVGWILMMGVLSYDLAYAISIVSYTIKNASDPFYQLIDSEPISYFWIILPIIAYAILILILFTRSVWEQFRVSIVQRVLSFCTGFFFIHGLFFFYYFFMEFYD